MDTLDGTRTISCASLEFTGICRGCCDEISDIIFFDDLITEILTLYFSKEYKALRIKLNHMCTCFNPENKSEIEKKISESDILFILIEMLRNENSSDILSTKSTLDIIDYILKTFKTLSKALMDYNGIQTIISITSNQVLSPVISILEQILSKEHINIQSNIIDIINFIQNNVNNETVVLFTLLCKRIHKYHIFRPNMDHLFQLYLNSNDINIDNKIIIIHELSTRYNILSKDINIFLFIICNIYNVSKDVLIKVFDILQLCITSDSYDKDDIYQLDINYIVNIILNHEDDIRYKCLSFIHSVIVYNRDYLHILVNSKFLHIINKVEHLTYNIKEKYADILNDIILLANIDEIVVLCNEVILNFLFEIMRNNSTYQSKIMESIIRLKTVSPSVDKTLLNTLISEQISSNNIV